MNSSDHQIICGDAGALGAVADESIELVVTSPPYPMIAMWDAQFAERSDAVATALERDDGEGAFAAMHRMLDDVWLECHRLLAPGGILCVNVGDAVRTIGGRFQLFSNHSRITSALSTAGFSLLPLVIWHKPTNAPTKFMGSGMLPGGAYVTLEHEYVVIARKGLPRKATTPAERARRRRSAVFWEERNQWFSDIWRLAAVRQGIGGSSGRTRSAAFPIELPYRLVAMYSWEGDTVLDPFAGTGTTTLAAMSLARNSLAVELVPEMVDEACGRILAGGTAQELRRRTERRLASHRAFLETRDAPTKHVNRFYGFPVVTGQETDLVLPLVSDVRVTEERRIAVDYEPGPDSGQERSI